MTSARRRISKGEASFNFVYLAYKARARYAGLGFNLSEEEFRGLTGGSCRYCGAVPSNTTNRKQTNGQYVYSGIDRVDNAKGYIIDNCVSCCKLCNRAKGTMTTREFYLWIGRVYSHAEKRIADAQLHERMEI
jgi:5-methylcytosine-specific restriction endonuclease McrA